MKLIIRSKRPEEIEQALNKLVVTIAGRQDELNKKHAFAGATWKKLEEGKYEVEMGYSLANPATDFFLKMELEKTLKKIDSDAKFD